MNTVLELIRFAKSQLKSRYDAREIKAIILSIFVDYFKFSSNDIYLKENDIQTSKLCDDFFIVINRLINGEPLNYILGFKYCMNLCLKLNRDTLIPRPETEELVLFANDKIKDKKSLLDIGTGSGFIAIALAKLNPLLNVTASDISSDALKIAHENAILNNVSVNFKFSDILDTKSELAGMFDIVISNPPYIRESEKAQMRREILDFEPSRALFVPTNNALIFYKKIAEYALIHLNDKGHLFFEINENLSQETLKLIESLGFSDSELVHDINNKPRIIHSRFYKND
ncbi:MAG: peptide chain release factor N(5)-glutamine methyltransferase [Bacilli bacterium]